MRWVSRRVRVTGDRRRAPLPRGTSSGARRLRPCVGARVGTGTWAQFQKASPVLADGKLASEPRTASSSSCGRAPTASTCSTKTGSGRPAQAPEMIVASPIVLDRPRVRGVDGRHLRDRGRQGRARVPQPAEARLAAGRRRDRGGCACRRAGVSGGSDGSPRRTAAVPPRASTTQTGSSSARRKGPGRQRASPAQSLPTGRSMRAAAADTGLIKVSVGRSAARRASASFRRFPGPTTSTPRG